MKILILTRFLSLLLNVRLIVFSWLCLFLLLSVPANAEWYWIHGHSGHIQDKSVIKTPDMKYVWVPVEQGNFNSHAKETAWCPAGYFVVALDLDQDSQLSAHDSPVIGQVLCGRALQPKTRFGWGLDFKMKTDKSNWIHFAIPSSQQKRVRYIRLRFWTNNTWSKVTYVHIWNGDKKVKEFKQTWSNGTKNIKLDLGNLIKFDQGIGISVGVKASPHLDTIQHHFKFYSVGANFVD